MNNIIENYVIKYKWPDEFTKNLLIKIENYEDDKWNSHSYTNGQSLDKVEYDNEFKISSICDCLDRYTYEKMMDLVWNNLRMYCNDVQKMIKMDDYALTWNGFTQPRINKYDEKTEMREHFDHINSIFDGERKGIPIFTVLGLLQNAEEGGEFYMWGDKEIKMESGEIIVFPSNFLFRHKVNKIKSGQRISFVSWAW